MNAINNNSRRNTKQRAVIFDELKKTKIHPTASTLFMMVKERYPAISFATVYRNLNLLAKEGKILELCCGKNSSRYDGNISQHYHFSCISCQNVFDIYDPLFSEIDNAVRAKTGFDIRFHRINFFGYCPECSNKVNPQVSKDTQNTPQAN